MAFCTKDLTCNTASGEIASIPFSVADWTEEGACMRLDEFIVEHSRDPYVLMRLASVFRRFAALQRESLVQHGDLHPCNIFVKRAWDDWQVRIIDCDTIFKQAPHSEIARKSQGDANFQHPLRDRRFEDCDPMLIDVVSST